MFVKTQTELCLRQKIKISRFSWKKYAVGWLSFLSKMSKFIQNTEVSQKAFSRCRLATPKRTPEQAGKQPRFYGHSLRWDAHLCLPVHRWADCSSCLYSSPERQSGLSKVDVICPDILDMNLINVNALNELLLFSQIGPTEEMLQLYLRNNKIAIKSIILLIFFIFKETI